MTRTVEPEKLKKLRELQYQIGKEIKSYEAVIELTQKAVSGGGSVVALEGLPLLVEDAINRSITEKVLPWLYEIMEDTKPPYNNLDI